MSVSERSFLLDSSSDEILDSLEMTENLRSKIDCVFAQIPEMDKNLGKISSYVSSLEKKFDKLDARVNKLKANQSEVRGKVKDMEDGLNEINKQVHEVNCEKAC